MPQHNPPHPSRFPRRTVHLDFHTGPQIPGVGEDFDPTTFAQTFRDARVDSVTVFAKCHHGRLYYGTDRPERHPGLAPGLDLLAEQIDALHAVGIRAPIFTAQDCASCPVREKCTTAANGKWGRSLTLLPRDQQEVLEGRRREQLTDQWRQRYNARAGVEGTISQAVRHTGIRRTRHTGLAKTHLGNVLATTAINIIRLDAWLTATPLGRTRTSHLARLDLAA